MTHRSKNDGDLGLHSVKEKSRAFLIKSFLETAVGSFFKKNVYHEAIYKHYVLNDTIQTDPGLPPYFSEDFINDIKHAIQKDLPVETMSLRDWYLHLLNKNVLCLEDDREAQ